MNSQQKVNNILLNSIQLTQALDATLDGLLPELIGSQKQLALKLKVNCKFWMDEFMNKKDKQVVEDATDANGVVTSLFLRFAKMNNETKEEALAYLDQIINNQKD